MQIGGFPKFKRKGIHDSFRLTGSINIYERSVKLPRMGVMKLKEETKVSGRILSSTVSREADRWYVSITVEDDIKEPDIVTNGEVVGIDVGLLSFAVISDGKVGAGRYIRITHIIFLITAEEKSKKLFKGEEYGKSKDYRNKSIFKE